jgi:dGTPase
LEGKIVRLVDRIAYINHDIDDAVRAGVLAPSSLPAEEIAVLGDTGSARIDTLVHDLVEHSERAGDIVQGDDVGGAMVRLRSFMFENVYLGPTARAEHAKIERVLRGLFEWYCSHPDELPPGPDLADRVIDWLAGMTDRYAIRAWTERFVPQGLAV